MSERKQESPTPIPKPPPRPWRRVAFSFSKDKKNKDDLKVSDRDREVAKGLEAIYLTEGTKDDLKTMSRVKRSRAWRLFAWVVAVCGLASVCAWAGLWYFGAGASQEASGIVLAVEGPSSIGLGREESFIISWSNPTMQSEQEVELRLSAPAEMLVSSLTPVPDNAQNPSWKLGSVAPGAKGEIRLKSVFLGTLGAQNAIQVVATSRGGESGKPRQALVTHAIVYGETVLSGAFHVPSKVVAGDEIRMQYAVANHGTQGLRGLRVRLQLPDGFAVSATGTGSGIASEDRIWERPLGDLVAGTTNTVSLLGTFEAGSSGDVPLSAQIGVSRSDGSFLPLLVGESTLTVLAGDLGLHLVANGTDKDATIAPGDPLRVTVEYKNLSPESLSDVRLRLGFESLVDGVSATGTSLLVWNELEDDGKGATSTRTRVQFLAYDKDAIPILARLEPQEEGTFDINIPTRSIVAGMKDAIVRLTLEGSMALVGKDRSTRVIRTTPLAFRYRTDAVLSAEARYFTEEGAPIGSGPLPPKAGKTTAYRIFWNVKKSFHALDAFEVSAVLPASVSFGSATSVEAGAISYDEATRTVRWSLNLMPEDVDELTASFDVKLTPTDFDVGRFAQLLGESRLTAKDSTVNENIDHALPPLTSDLQNDDGARSKGVVKKTSN